MFLGLEFGLPPAGVVEVFDLEVLEEGVEVEDAEPAGVGGVVEGELVPGCK